MGERASFAQSINATEARTSTRYSPAQITGIEIVPRLGDPDPAHISALYCVWTLAELLRAAA
jgi:hypothetical protein